MVFIVVFLIQVTLMLELGQELLLIWVPPSPVRLRHTISHLNFLRTNFVPKLSAPQVLYGSAEAG